MSPMAQNSCSFLENLAKFYIAPPRVGAHSYGESWIRTWKVSLGEGRRTMFTVPTVSEYKQFKSIPFQQFKTHSHRAK